MEDNLKKGLLIFAASAAAGLAAGTLAAFVRRKLEERRNADEFERTMAARDEYSTIPPCWDIPEGVNVVDEDDLVLRPVDYTAYSKHGQKEEAEEPVDDGIEVISEEEFVRGTGNLLDGYVSVTGTYFANEKLLAGWDDALDERDVASTVGAEAISKLEEDGVDAVYVKNERLKVLYEIVKSNEEYEVAAREALSAEADDPAFTDES